MRIIKCAPRRGEGEKPVAEIDIHPLTPVDDQGLDDFEALLDAGDDRIYAWVMGNDIVPDTYDTPVFALIKSFKES